MSTLNHDDNRSKEGERNTSYVRLFVEKLKTLQQHSSTTLREYRIQSSWYRYRYLGRKFDFFDARFKDGNYLFQPIGCHNISTHVKIKIKLYDTLLRGQVGHQDVVSPTLKMLPCPYFQLRTPSPLLGFQFSKIEQF